MRTDRKQIVAVFAGLIMALALFGLYVQIRVRHASTLVAEEKYRVRQEISSRETEIANLRQLQQELRNADFVTNDALIKERKNAERLRRRLESAIGQNKVLMEKMSRSLADKQGLAQAKDELDTTFEALTVENAGLQKEIELLRKNFDVAFQVRVRLAQVQESIDGLVIQKGKENILQLQMDALIREIEDINQYLSELRDNRLAPGLAAPRDRRQTVSPDIRPGTEEAALEIKYLEQVNDLKARINILTNENTVLKEKYLMAQDISAQSRKVLDTGSQKIFELQSKLIETESALSQSKTRYQDLERNVASLRERYVANELEKEGLKIKLNQLTAELNDVRSKFLALLGKITDIFQSPGPEISSSQRYNLTSIIGVELFPNTTDTGQ